ncbi:hypothetical protein ACP70R_037370 [Stipagrostis hirtigluma subsp. patula]
MGVTKVRDRRGRRARLRLPMILRCNACNEPHTRGTRLIAFKEDLTAGERHLSAVKVFRFYFRCTSCSAEIAYKTDPENSDYIVEAGATRQLE